jgi:serine/threonine-protein kinase
VRFGIPAAAAVLGAAVALGAVVFADRRDEQAERTAQVERDLPPEEALLLRVVATPWAHVLVDGEHLETTPFARPLALTPGKHLVRLEHPNAAPEERIVEGRAGQAVLLNVQMHVERPLTLDAPREIPEENSP